MLTAALAVLLLTQAPVPGIEVRSLTVTVTDESGAPVPGLGRDDVVVLENGVARDLTALKRDTRPLTLVLIVDSSAAVATSFRLSLLDEIVGFLRLLPEGSRYSLWTTGDRPTRRLDFTDDIAAAAGALRLVHPQGGNTLLDALVEATADLKKREGERTAVVAVTAVGPEFSSRDRYQVVSQAQRNAGVFMAVQFEEGETTFQNRTDQEFALQTLTSKSGGLYERPLSAMGAGVALERVAAEFSGQYRLSYATVAGLKERKLEVRVARPGARVRLGLSVSEGSPAR
jgi:VWFA-related protein